MGKFKQEAIEDELRVKWPRSNFESILEGALGEMDVVNTAADNEQEQAEMVRELEERTIKDLQEDLASFKQETAIKKIPDSNLEIILGNAFEDLYNMAENAENMQDWDKSERELAERIFKELQTFLALNQETDEPAKG